MNSTATIKNTLDSFLKENEFSVLVLRGSWGIGKTYFWQSYIEEEKKGIKQPSKIQNSGITYDPESGVCKKDEKNSKGILIDKILIWF